MTPTSAEEALDALDRVGGTVMSDTLDRDVYLIRSFIERAAREQAAWAKLEAWVGLGNNRSWALRSEGGRAMLTLCVGIWKACTEWGGTRLEAIEAAAAWREQQEKA